MIDQPTSSDGGNGDKPTADEPAVDLAATDVSDASDDMVEPASDASPPDASESAAKSPDEPHAELPDSVSAEESESEPGSEEATPPGQVCPSCGEHNGPAMTWCEACGADLAAAPSEASPARACTACEAPPSAITADGWCEECGQRQPNKRDHNALDLGTVFGATDKGLRHHQNEDAMAMAVTAVGAIMVVCDGVSSTERPEEASQAAADAALGVLVEAGADSDPSATAPTVAEALVAAAGSAQDRVFDISQELSGGEPPSCTFVAAVVEATPEGLVATIGWLGDSRAYWIGSDGAELLTTDHSWAELQRSLGTLSEDEIVKDRRAHSITRWIGVDVDDPVPDMIERTFVEPGMLVLCSDGLWNYAAEPAALAERIVEAQSDSESNTEIVEHLISFANASGGRDNITVCIVDSKLFANAGTEDQTTQTRGG